MRADYVIAIANSVCLCLFLSVGYSLPVVCAEWEHRQPFTVDHVAVGIVSPSVAYCHGHRNFLIRHHYVVAVDISVCPMEFMVGSSNRKALQLAATAWLQSSCGVAEVKAYPVAFNPIAFVYRARVLYLLAVGECPCQQSESSAHLLLVLRVDVVGLANIDCARHCRVMA